MFSFANEKKQMFEAGSCLNLCHHCFATACCATKGIAISPISRFCVLGVITKWISSLLCGRSLISKLFVLTNQMNLIMGSASTVDSASFDAHTVCHVAHMDVTYDLTQKLHTNIVVYIHACIQLTNKYNE